MAIIELEFGRQSKPGPVEHDRDEMNRMVNAFVEDMGREGSKRQLPIRSSPGLDLWGTAPNGLPIRGMFPSNGTLYVVAGTVLYPVDQDGGFGTALGGVPGTDLVGMAANRRQPNPELVIVIDGLKFLIDTDPTGRTQTPITDADLPPPIDVAFVDGYMLYLLPDSRVFASGIENAGSIDANADFKADAVADASVAIAVRQREVFIFNETSAEVFANTGEDVPAPFARALGEHIDVGCASRRSVKPFILGKDADIATLAWVDNFNRVVIADGYTPRRVSHHAVERDIEDLADKSEITALTYHMAGHRFYQISSSQWTWELNGTTGLWHNRESYQSKRYRGAVATTFAGKQLIGDRTNGKIYAVNRKTFTEAGQPLIWTVRAPQMQAYPHSLKFNALWLDMVPGVGLNSTDPALKDPKVMLRWSDNDGNSWKGPRNLPMGKIGEKSKRIKTTRLGQTKEDGRIFEVSVSAAVARGLTGAAVDVTKTRA